MRAKVFIVYGIDGLGQNIEQVTNPTPRLVRRRLEYLRNRAGRWAYLKIGKRRVDDDRIDLALGVGA